MEKDNGAAPKAERKRFSGLQVFGIVLVAVILTAGAMILAFKSYFFPSEFKPVTLSRQEEEVLTAKLEKLEAVVPEGETAEPPRPEGKDALEPEPYSEKDLKREIVFTERELNALLAKNTDLARKLAVDLSEDLISAKLILPVDEDFPLFGGKTLRLRSGVGFTYREGRPVVVIKGVTFMGVPVPNAWLGGIKNIDLVERFGTEKGFWKGFSDGVADIKVEEGVLKIKLKE